MTVYWDSSALVTLSAAVFEKLRSPGRHTTLSHVTELELACAAARVSGRRRPAGARLDHTLLGLYRRLAKISLPVNLDALFQSARRVGTLHRLGANDSLHLAASLFLMDRLAEPVEFASCDRRLRLAAAKEGLLLFPA